MSQDIDISAVAEILREKQRELKQADPEATSNNLIEEWVHAKSIDGDSLMHVVDQLVQAAFERCMGKLTTGGDPTTIQNELKNAIGTGFELGYTTSELQLELELTEGGEDIDAENS